MLRDGLWGFQPVVAILVTFLLALPPGLGAQPPAANPAPQAPNPAPLAVESLKIYVLQGDREIHDIRVRAAATVVIEVRDDTERPVEGVEVTFDLPAIGPGGLFAGQQPRFSTKTNLQGQAAATFTPNSEIGRFNIRVTAVVGNRAGHAVIAQSNARRAGVAEPKTGGLLKFAWWKVGVVAAVGAAVGIIVATRGGSSSSPVLIPGTPTFGAP